MKTVTLILVLLTMTFLMSEHLYAEHDSSRYSAIKEGIQAVEIKDYPTAIELLREAIKEQPENSEYHRWLARVYGLQAQSSSWIKAMPLAKSARRNFEKAVKLDPENRDALLDLREFYRRAPEFLGGGQEKANEITKQLKALGYKSEN